MGGAESFFVSLSAALARAGVTVHAILRASDLSESALTAAGVPFATARFGRLLDPFTGWRLRRVASDFTPDIVLAFAGRAAAMMPRGAYTLIGRLGGYYNLKNFRRCDYLVCNTPDLVRYVTAGGWPAGRVFHIPNFPNLAQSEAASRAGYATPESAPLALALGRLHPNKAVDVLLRAAAKIPGLWVWIAGDGPERARLERLAQELGVAPRVRFLGWCMNRTALFKAADICVYPSRKEPFGNVVIEAWGCGVPLVAAASTGPASLIRPGEDGVLVPVDDAEALADAIRSILAAPDFARLLAENGKRRVEQEFSETAIVRRYLDLFEMLRPRRPA